MLTTTGSKSSYPFSIQPCRRLEFADVMLATKNFNESLVIGHGGFGKVYKGTLINGSVHVVVAIKRLDSMSSQGADEFWAEVELLGMLRHANIVSLFGYCNYEKEMILVYEYMPNRTLEDHLHKLGTSLSWIQRLKICIGAGRGIHYLHTGTGIEIGVIHRDFKSSNILLNETWAAKISDFGLSRTCPVNQPLTYVSTHVKGTFGYLDPEYFYSGRLTRKSDVYAFGVVLLEVLCRKRAVDSSLDEDQWNLARWVQESIKAGNLKHVIDPDIRGQISSKCLKEFVQIAERCLSSNPKHRPTMAKVLVGLEYVEMLQVKNNNSLQTADTTIFGKITDMFAFHSKAVNPGGRHAFSREGFQTWSKRRAFKDHVGSINSFHNTAMQKCENLMKQKQSINGSISSDEKPTRRDLLGTRKGSPDCMIPSTKLRVFRFADLEKATSNFSPDMLLCEGGFGNAFLGWVDMNMFTPSSPADGTAIVVKEHIFSSSQGRDEWMEELRLFSRLAHPNIISLLGYCDDKNHGYHGYLLVYEYTQSRNFGQFIHRGSCESLSWAIRLRIMIGVARGLTYLHSLKLMCRGIKSSEILLDQDFNATLGDFEPEEQEIALTTMVSGASGNLDPYPYFCITGNWTLKSDIYGFGVLLLETLTGLRIFDNSRPKEQENLITWSSRFVAEKREIKEIMDPRLKNNYSKEGAFKCTALALECLMKVPRDRPSSKEVLESLEKIYAINE